MARRDKHPGWFTLPGGEIVDVPVWTPPQVDLPDNPMAAIRGLLAFATLVWDEIGWLWGGSRELVRKPWLPAKQYRLLGDWVRNLEVLVRRVIIIFALGMKLPPLRPNPGPWGPGRYRRALKHDPTSWHVSFSMLPRRGGGRRYARKKTPPLSRRPAWRLAFRIEALRRVLSYPRGCAMRFARTLHRIRNANAAANAPRRIRLEDWDFGAWRRTPGKHAIAEGMELAQPLSTREWDRFWEEPG